MILSGKMFFAHCHLTSYHHDAQPPHIQWSVYRNVTVYQKCQEKSAKVIYVVKMCGNSGIVHFKLDLNTSNIASAAKTEVSKSA